MILDETGDYAQEFFSEDSVNVQRVLSWRVRDENAQAPDLRVDFHNSFYFDSDRTTVPAEVLRKTIRQLQWQDEPCMPGA